MTSGISTDTLSYVIYVGESHTAQGATSKEVLALGSYKCRVGASGKFFLTTRGEHLLVH